jgi:hypothetical protein
MKLVQGDEIPLLRGLEYRGGMFHSRRVLEGDAGSIDNFQLSIGVSQGDFYSPRHHHNFEQIRVGLEGTLDFDRDGKMSPGVVGYFPEGVYYGPQSQDPNGVSTAAVLQFGGASGSGYLSNAEVRAGMEELKKHGEFKNGVYHRLVPFHGKKNADGYQAIWEHRHQRPMVYPAPRYTKPVFMNAANSEWIPVDGAPGVFEKLLGVFTERRTQAGFLKLTPGASHTAKGRSVYLTLSGAGEIDGEPMRKLTALYLALGESATITAREDTELMHFGLPNLTGLRMPARDEMPAEAAE